MKGHCVHAVTNAAETITNVPNLLLKKWFMPECKAVTKTEEGYLLKLIHGEQQFANETATAKDEIQEIKVLFSDMKEIWFLNTVKKVPSTKMNSDGPYTFPISDGIGKYRFGCL